MKGGGGVVWLLILNINSVSQKFLITYLRQIQTSFRIAVCSEGSFTVHSLQDNFSLTICFLFIFSSREIQS